MNKIERLRREKNLSQKELGEMLELTQSAISKIETGATLPSMETARKLANALGCTLDELFGAEEGEAEE
nr:MAG TPA: Helix-turn-helix XRE-family like protein [Caudoviricetes sp.]